MSVTLAVSSAVLQQVKGRWDEAADELDGNWRRLHRTSTAGFSSEVAAAVEAFREPWVDEIKASAGQAQGYSDEITVYRGLIIFTDSAQAERVRSLLPWIHHAAEIRER